MREVVALRGEHSVARRGEHSVARRGEHSVALRGEHSVALRGERSVAPAASTAQSYIPTAARRAAARSVRSHEKSGSVRPKWP